MKTLLATGSSVSILESVDTVYNKSSPRLLPGVTFTKIVKYCTALLLIMLNFLQAYCVE